MSLPSMEFCKPAWTQTSRNGSKHLDFQNQSSADDDAPDVNGDPNRPSHFPHKPKIRPSLLTSPDQLTISEGFLNLTLIFMIAGVMWQGSLNYNIIGNVIDLDILKWLFGDFVIMLAIWLGLLSWSATSYFLCKVWARRLFPPWLVIFAYSLSQAVLFGVPVLLTYSDVYLSSPLTRCALAMQLCVLSFKMHSYFMTNLYLSKEAASRKAKEAKAVYPGNLTFRGFAWFLFAPTLVYEVEFPRQQKRDWANACRLGAIAIVCMLVMYFLLVHHIYVVLMKAGEMSLLASMVRLTVPSILFWCLGFVSVFHCGLNAWSEVVLFADREFYQDWWNATCMVEFWKKWNRPVYKFMCRHIYVESMKTVRLPPALASLGTMLVTAVLHELIMGMALGMLRPWFFTIIMLQVPFLWFTSLFRGTRFGNFVVWIGMFLGQPLVLILYAREAALRRLAAP